MMRRTTQLLVSTLFLLGSGCAEKPRDFYQQVLMARGEIVDFMWQVTDEESAAGKFTPAFDRFKENMSNIEKKMISFKRSTPMEAYFRKLREVAINPIEREKDIPVEIAVQRQRCKPVTAKETEAHADLVEYCKARKEFLTSRIPLEIRLNRERERLFRLADLYVAKRIDDLVAQGHKNPMVSYKEACPNVLKVIAELTNYREPSLILDEAHGKAGPIELTELDKDLEFKTDQLAATYPSPPLRAMPPFLGGKFILREPPLPAASLVAFAAHRGEFPKNVETVAISFRQRKEGNFYEIGLSEFKDEDGFNPGGAYSDATAAWQDAGGIHALRVYAARQTNPNAEGFPSTPEGRAVLQVTLKRVRWVYSASTKVYYPPREKLPIDTREPQADISRFDLEYFLGNFVPPRLD